MGSFCFNVSKRPNDGDDSTLSKKRKIESQEINEAFTDPQVNESIFSDTNSSDDYSATLLTRSSRSSSVSAPASSTAGDPKGTQNTQQGRRRNRRGSRKEVSLNCEECQKTYHRRDRFNRHNLLHHSSSRAFNCDWPGCGKDLASKELLNRHYKCHQNPNKHYCLDFPSCTKHFRKKSTMQQHYDKEHSEQLPCKAANLHCPELDPTTAQKCDLKFSSVTMLEQHIQKGHESGVFWCAVCIKIDEVAADKVKFTTSVALKAHQNDVHPPTCSSCSMKFRDQTSLKKHELNHRSSVTERKTWNCPESQCDKSFTSKSNLNNHRRKIHDQAKRYVCGEEDLSTFSDIAEWSGSDACGSSYAHKVSLVNHVRTHHLGLDQRGYRRKQRKERAKRATLSELEAGHNGAHDGVNLSCVFPDCSRIFFRTYDLGHHLQISHGLEEEEIGEVLAEDEALHGGQFWIGSIREESLIFPDQV